MQLPPCSAQMTQDGHKLTFKLLELEGKEGKHKWVAGKGLEGEISLPHLRRMPTQV